MSLADELEKRMKPVGVLYVNVFPARMSGDNPEFLLLKRRADVVMPNVWQPVSGKIREGETIKAAFFRQVEQKTGIVLPKMYRSDTVHIYYDDYYDAVMAVPFAFCFLEQRNIVLNSSLHCEYTWVSEKQFAVMNPFVAHQRFVEHIATWKETGVNSFGFWELQRD